MDWKKITSAAVSGFPKDFEMWGTALYRGKLTFLVVKMGGKWEASVKDWRAEIPKVKVFPEKIESLEEGKALCEHKAKSFVI